jgi:hypothetical protein
MTSETRSTSIDHAIGPTGQLIVKVAAAEIRIVPSADDHVRVRSVDGRPLSDDIKFETGDGSLSIRESGRFLGISVSIGQDRSAGLELEVPPAAETLIQTASGALSARGMIGEQHYRTASGDIRLDGAAGSVTAETVSGDVVIGVAGRLELIVKSVSGDVSLDGESIDRVRLTTTSGDIRLVSDLGAGPHAIETLSGDALIATKSGVRIQARTISGDLRSDLPHTADGMMGRRSLIVGDGAVELSFRSVSGDLRVVDPATARDRTDWKPVPPTAPSLPIAPAMPKAPAMPQPPSLPSVAATTDPATNEASPNDDRRLEIMRALERGDIDIASAGDQLAALDEPTHG